VLEQLDNFLIKGYAIFSNPNLIDLSLFKIINVEIEEDLPDVTDTLEKHLLQQFVDYVSEQYVSKVYDNFEIRCVNVWDGVDLGSMCWHNDLVENFDFNVLYYYDNTSIDVGGQIEFKYPGGEDIVYPQAGNLIFINQSLQFQHKANRSTAPRRVASIEYKIIK
jgi:hypothetical protein